MGLAPKHHVSMRVDRDVLQWFRASGRGYRRLINNVLRVFMQWCKDSPSQMQRFGICAEEDGLCLGNDKNAPKSGDAILRGVKDALPEAG